MKIGVLIKQVPDTETKIRIAGDAKDIVRDGIKHVMNPYDEYAVEQALLVREKVGGDTTVSVVSLGPARVLELGGGLGSGESQVRVFWGATHETYWAAGGAGFANRPVTLVITVS